MKRICCSSPWLLVACLVAARGRVGPRRRAGPGRRQAATSSCPATPAGPSAGSPAIRAARRAARRTRSASAADGWIVAFTVTLSEPAAEQIDSFNARFGGPPQVRLAGPAPGRHPEDAAQPPPARGVAGLRAEGLLRLEPDLRAGGAAAGPRRATVVALTVATWAPMFAADLPRQQLVAGSSRLKNKCEKHAQLRPVRAGGPARGRRLGLHLQDGAAALHRHVHAGQPADHHRRRRLVAPARRRGLFRRPRCRASIGLVTTEGWIFMVGFRVFDVGLLIVWLIWFFRLRDDDDDSHERGRRRRRGPGAAALAGDGPGGDGIRLPLGRWPLGRGRDRGHEPVSARRGAAAAPSRPSRARSPRGCASRARRCPPTACSSLPERVIGSLARWVG